MASNVGRGFDELDLYPKNPRPQLTPPPQLTPEQQKEKIKQQNEEMEKRYGHIGCNSCRLIASFTNNPNYKCDLCRRKQSAGFHKKSKTQRRKKSKFQRRRKSIKRRH